MLLVFGVGLVAWNGFQLYQENGSTWGARLARLLIGAFATFAVPMSQVRLRRAYRRLGAIRDERQIDLLEEGLYLQTATSSGLLPWNSFTAWVEGEQMILLFPGPGIFQMWPKRIVPAELVEVLRERLGAPIG